MALDGISPVQALAIHFFTSPPAHECPPGGAIVRVGATLHPTAPARVTPVTTPDETVAVAMGRVVHTHPVTVTIGAVV